MGEHEIRPVSNPANRTNFDELRMVPARIEQSTDSRQVVIEGWQLDLAARTARRDGVVRRISPKASQVLDLLICADGGVVSREDLLDRAWSGVCVGDESLTQAIAELRRVLVARQSGVKIIETIPKRGYRLAVAVTVGGADHQERCGSVLGLNEGFDLLAYSACLEARHIIARGGCGAIERSVTLTKQALEQAPTFAQAHADNAICLVFAHLYAGAGDDALAEAADHAQRATELRPDLGLGHAAFGFLCGAHQDREGAWAAFGRALGRDGADGFTHYLCARTLFSLGDHGAATAIAERAAVLSPEDFRPLCVAARACAKLDRQRAARNAASGLDRVECRLAQDPGEYRALAVRILLLSQLGRHEEAYAALERDWARGSQLDYYRFVAAAALGEKSLALDIFEAVTDLGWRHPGWLAAEQIPDDLAAEPRFQKRARAIGLN